MEKCLFCGIARGELPCSKIHESDRVLAFLDISPINKGHILILPKEHHELITEIPDEINKEIMIVIKKATKKLLESGAEGVNVLQNNKKAAGQIVNHVHFHIIPRYKDDGFIIASQKSEKYEQGEEKKFTESLGF